jgi:FemAB-related protein (PEP-CTERM system-associated)
MTVTTSPVLAPARLIPNDVATFIERHAAEPFYYQVAWLDLITRLYGYTLVPLVTRDTAGEVTGYLPLFLMRSPLTGRRAVSLPFSDCCPPLATDAASATALIDQAIELARRERVRYLELRAGPSAVAAMRDDFVASNLYVRWVVDVSAGEDALWRGLRSPVQRQVKKARKQGVQVRAASSRADMDTYYHLHLRTRSGKHGMPAQPRSYFLGLWDTFGASGAVRVLLAEHEGQPIAGMVLLVSGNTVRYAYGASREEYLHLGPNNLLMWEALTWAAGQGCARLDLGRTASDNRGLMEFKRGWGAVEEPLPYYYWPRVAGLATTEEQSWKFRLLTNVWRRLPLAVAGPLGGALYRHLG